MKYRSIGFPSASLASHVTIAFFVFAEYLMTPAGGVVVRAAAS